MKGESRAEAILIHQYTEVMVKKNMIKCLKDFGIGVET